MTTTDLAISHARFARESENPVKTVLDCCYISLALLYEELARVKAIPGLMELPKEKKIGLWRQTSGSRFKRTCQCQALWMWELINREMPPEVSPVA